MKLRHLFTLAVAVTALAVAACQRDNTPAETPGEGSGETPGGGGQEQEQDPDAVEAASWNFGAATWQDEFAAKGAAKTELSAFTLVKDKLTLCALDKCKYDAGYFQMGGTGSREGNYFKFSAAKDGLLTLTQSHTGSTAPDPVRSVVVYNNGNEQTMEGSVSSKTIKECKFSVKAGEVYIYQTGGMRYYSISFGEGSGSGGEEGGGESGEVVPANPDGEFDCTTPPTVGDVTLEQLTGYAQAANVTGGAGGQTLHFDNGKALQTWLLARTKTEKNGDHTPVTIWLSGTFVPTDGRDFSEAHPWFDVKDVSNLSFIGTDSFVMDRIGIFCVRANNVIIRNINFRQPKASNGADAVSMQECDGVWVDHCTFTSLNQEKDYEDGSTDITHGSKNVTVSWCHYIKTQKSCLVGHSNSQSGDTQITATFHHNWFEGSSSRHPRVRFGKVHVYNNLYDNNTTFGVGSAYGAKVLVEYNYFDGLKLPTDICTYPAKDGNVSNLQGSVAGYLYPTQNLYVNRPAERPNKAMPDNPYPLYNVQYTKYGGTPGTALTYTDFKPAYDYTVTAAENVPAVVKAGSGYGKLGYTQAPVAVDNGGITDFNGSDDDNPSNPDTGDEDDPIDPNAAHSYVLSYNGSPVQTVDGQAGGTYFDASSSKADLTKDYGGPFTIGGTSYSQGFKMDSKGYVKFTTSASFNSSIKFYVAKRKADATASMQLIPENGDAIVFADVPNGSYKECTATLSKGVSYELKQVSGEQGVILVAVTETE